MKTTTLTRIGLYLVVSILMTTAVLAVCNQGTQFCIKTETGSCPLGNMAGDAFPFGTDDNPAEDAWCETTYGTGYQCCHVIDCEGDECGNGGACVADTDCDFYPEETCSAEGFCIESTEQCDDINAFDTYFNIDPDNEDGICVIDVLRPASSCRLNICGDGYLYEAGNDGIVGTADDEECDLGPLNGVLGSGCTSTCKAETHLACVGLACQVVSGPGPDTCADVFDCLTCNSASGYCVEIPAGQAFSDPAAPCFGDVELTSLNADCVSQGYTHCCQANAGNNICIP